MQPKSKIYVWYISDNIVTFFIIVEWFLESLPREFWMDTEFGENREDGGSSSWFLFGPKCMANKIYQFSPTEVS